MKKIIIPIIVLSVLLSGCTKWLNVKPEDKFIEEEVLETPQGFKDALNGIYLKLGSNNMYGNELNLRTLDLLAQLYYTTPLHDKTTQQLVVYDYGQDEVKKAIDNIWTNMYVNITNVNRFLENLETYGAVLDEVSKNIMKGEGHAIRAFLYFDLLRMFAPNYVNDPQAMYIPYYDKTGYESAPYSPSSFVVDKILSDLKVAEDILKVYDPVMFMEVVDQTRGIYELGSMPYLQFRNYHMNYFAVKGLQARVLLYQGDKSAALAAAKEVIDNQKKFPWIKSSSIGDKSTANRVFSTELLFAFENPKLYQIYDSQFSGALDDKVILSAGTNPKFLNTIFDNWPNDYRYGNMWDQTAGKSYHVFTKYRDITASNKSEYNFRYTVPGIRISEIFLIAAECETDASQGLAYLNEVRKNRNSDALSNANNLSTDIMKEYRKEFYGEGQLWYYYKRTNMRSIISAATNAQKAINLDQYTFPVPLSETQPR
ncbi:RagB/SusD family nutrient uptake outer membrane protein [Sphingobacterium yanglingense]|uniref:SusD-like starch-binding protein associating with outer membrane n=1 Tax=Sphingobacterium yanglingense TaxID=1437280 RepID=A0A4R6W515_9SPHI|nr:RagB/SusD family nutrient uptake outer membrane protein [Sphingobacterium yanglingense]TDQ72225.1 SusD-like starch-binding protein associating with outer membrane [Sphingobacterium yanglingense]